MESATAGVRSVRWGWRVMRDEERNWGMREESRGGGRRVKDGWKPQTSSRLAWYLPCCPVCPIWKYWGQRGHFGLKFPFAAPKNKLQLEIKMNNEIAPKKSHRQTSLNRKEKEKRKGKEKKTRAEEKKSNSGDRGKEKKGDDVEDHKRSNSWAAWLLWEAKNDRPGPRWARVSCICRWTYVVLLFFWGRGRNSNGPMRVVSPLFLDRHSPHSPFLPWVWWFDAPIAVPEI